MMQYLSFIEWKNGFQENMIEKRDSKKSSTLSYRNVKYKVSELTSTVGMFTVNRRQIKY